MAQYSFEDVETGEVRALEYPMADVPDWGKVVRVGGRRYKRLIDIPRLNPEFRGFASLSQSPVFDKAEQMEHVHGGKCSGFDEDSRPVFETKVQAKRWADRTGGAVTWDS